MSQSTLAPAPLAFTGERMVPFQSDSATELFHWQRYLYFRTWYSGVRVVDAASGEGYGLGYAAAFASSTLGIELSKEAVDHASRRYPHASFTKGDVVAADYSDADLVISFETIEHLSDPEAFLESLKSCQGRIVISTPNRNHHSPGNRLEDRPLNPYHTIEWTPAEFAELIERHFTGRTVRFLSQEDRWPGLIRPGLDENARYTIAVIGDGDLPNWPRLGLAMPTLEQADSAIEAVANLSKFYPGELHVAVVANGSSPIALAKLRDARDRIPHVITLLEEPKNLGYGVGANRGLDYLWQEGWFDYFGVVNDDVIPAVDCVPQMVVAMKELEAQGVRPGLVGPMSNQVNGAQLVDIGTYGTLPEMMSKAEAWSLQHHSSASQALQVRGLFWLIHPDCLSDVGGFDPRFGLGNFEDDDFNVRARCAGYSLWIVDGAFLHHEGSSTFKQLGLDYERNIVRNLGLFLEKWDIEDFSQSFALEVAPNESLIFSSLSAAASRSDHFITINGEPVDLVHQASEFDLAAWIVTCLRDRPREDRIAVLDALRAA